MSACCIERADEAALPPCLALLAPIVHPEAVVFAARDGGGRLLGAAGLLWQSWGQPGGFPAWVHVLPDCRRRGVGTALARRLAAAARGEALHLWAARPLSQDSPESAFALGLGFKESGRQLHFEARSADFLHHVERITGLLRKRGRIPANASTVDLEVELIAPVSDLLRRELPTVPKGIDRMMEQALALDPPEAPVDRDRSKILLADGQVAGALLSRRQENGRDSSIICNVVAPQWRHGWANAMLLESTTRSGVEDGCETFRFDCDERSRDTIGLADRCGARLIRTDALYRYAVASAD